MESVVLDGEHLTIEQVMQVAYGQPGAPTLTLSDSAQARVNRSAAAVQQLLDRGEIAYGITTGFGAFKDRLISRADVETVSYTHLDVYKRQELNTRRDRLY